MARLRKSADKEPCVELKRVSGNRRVAIVGTRGYPSYYGGFETAVRKLAPYLVDRGWSVTVYGRDGATREDDPDRDVRVRSVFTRGVESKSISTLSYGCTAVFHASKEKPDVVLVMNVANGFFLPLLRVRGIPTLVNVDGIEWDRAKWGRLAKLVFRMGAKFTAWFGNRLVFDAHEIARRWQEDFNRDGVFIPYGGDSLEELPIEPGFRHREYVLLVARFVPENSVPEFFQAAARIAESVPVIIVGSSGYGGPLDEQAQALADENAGITWLGHISDDRRLLALWQHAAVYFHGHSVGGTNPTLVQAMAAGTPIAARDTPYNREVLEDAGVFFSPDPASISEVVLKLAGDTVLQDEVSRKARVRSKQIYTWELVNAAYEAELAALADAPRRR